jgi:hypothetical protein
MDKPLTTKEVAERLGVAPVIAYKLVSTCQDCGGSLSKAVKNQCTCGKRNTKIKGFDISTKNIRSEWRVDPEEVERFKREG